MDEPLAPVIRGEGPVSQAMEVRTAGNMVTVLEHVWHSNIVFGSTDLTASLLLGSGFDSEAGPAAGRALVSYLEGLAALHLRTSAALGTFGFGHWQ